MPPGGAALERYTRGNYKAFKLNCVIKGGKEEAGEARARQGRTAGDGEDGRGDAEEVLKSGGGGGGTRKGGKEKGC